MVKISLRSTLIVPTQRDALDRVLHWAECFRGKSIANIFGVDLLSNRVWLRYQVALAEGFTNVVRHAHKYLPADTPIELQIQLEGRRLVLRIWDSGPPFDLQCKLKERLERFKLELHPEKTRLIEFGRFAESDRKKRGEGKPETFNFLGFTHICGRTRKGRFQIRRKTQRRRLQAKITEIKETLRRRLHWKPTEVGRWLKSVLVGHYQYYGVPLNLRSLAAFRYRVLHLWLKTLRRRSQKARLSWERMGKLAKRWLPEARITQDWPNKRLKRLTRGRSPVR